MRMITVVLELQSVVGARNGFSLSLIHANGSRRFVASPCIRPSLLMLSPKHKIVEWALGPFATTHRGISTPRASLAQSEKGHRS
jgi:hypothetical protein